jgi:ribose transport system substrate-binding protein
VSLVRRTLIVALALALGIGLAACGSSSNSSSGTSAATSSGASGEPAFVTAAKAEVAKDTTVPEKTAAASLGSFKPKPGAKIFHIGCNQALVGCSSFAASVQKASAALGYQVTVCNSGTTPTTISGCFNQAVNAKPDAVIIQGVGTDLAADGYAKLKKAGIPIIGNVTGNTPGATPGVAAEVNGDTCLREGKMLGDWIIADSKGKANVTMYYTDIYKCVLQRASELQKALASCSTCKVKLQKFAIDQLQTGLPQQIQADLQSNPDVNYIVGGFDGIALVAVNAVRQTGKTSSIKVLGTDGDSPNLGLIAKGQIQQVDATSGFGEDGWLAVDAAARTISGQKVPANVPGSVFLIDPNNIAKAVGSSGHWNGPPNYEQQIKTLWGKG